MLLHLYSLVLEIKHTYFANWFIKLKYHVFSGLKNRDDNKRENDKRENERESMFN